jgi:hypothetical protein
MKFYKEQKKNIMGKKYYWNKIKFNKLTAILDSKNPINYINCVFFFKNGNYHNPKNATYIRHDGYKQFFLNNKCYGFEYHFNKESWRRFVKIQVFL